MEEYNGELTVSYETGETTQTKLIGISGEVPVGLEKEKVEALACYINDTSQTKFKIVNNSDFKVRKTYL